MPHSESYFVGPSSQPVKRSNIWVNRFNIRQDFKYSDEPRIRIMYIESKYTDFAIEKIKTMHNAFGDDLVVIWDHPKLHQCPFTDVRCISNETVTLTREWSLHWMAGLGAEKAAMWAFGHTHEFDYVWTMESDVHFTDVEILKRLVYSNSTTDFFTQEEGKDCSKSDDWWFWGRQFRSRWNSLGLPPMCHRGLHSLYRMSIPLMIRMEEIRQLSHGRWMYYEAFIPTVVRYFNLTEGLWWAPPFDIPAQMRYRPCFVDTSVPGIYHPVKHIHGEPVECMGASKPDEGLEGGLTEELEEEE
jgi:hypothetical protein